MGGRGRSGLTALFVATLILAGPPAALADRAEAARLFSAGESAADKADYQTAIRAFLASQEAEPHPNTLFALAQAYRQQYLLDRDPSKAREAVALYRQFVKDRPSSPWRPTADAYVLDLLAILAHLSPEPPPGAPPPPTTQIMVTSRTPGARIFVDDDERGTPPPAIQVVAEGDHRVRVEATGSAAETRTVRAIAERLVVVDIALEPLPGTIRVVANEDDATVYLDGRAAGIAPIERTGVRPGEHTLSVARRGRDLWTATLKVEPDRTALAIADLGWSTQAKAATYTALGGGVLAAASAVSGLLAFRADAGLTSAPRTTNPERAAYDDRLAERDGLALASNVLLAGAGAFLIVAAGLYWFDVPTAPR